MEINAKVRDYLERHLKEHPRKENAKFPQDYHDCVFVITRDLGLPTEWARIQVERYVKGGTG